MQSQSISPVDWHRWFFGDAPPLFLFEVATRAVIVFVALLVIVRFLGKRMNGQLTITEMAVMLTLGAIAANGMQIPDRGILQAVFVLILACAFQRGVTWLEVKSPRMEKLFQGSACMVVKNGVIDVEGLRSARISRDQLFAELRKRRLLNLGRARRVYLESAGLFSILETPGEKPGLSLLPAEDEKAQRQRRAAPEGWRACKCCGLSLQTSGRDPCPNCHACDWDLAVL